LRSTVLIASLSVLLLMIRAPPGPPLFPYTTLFRSSHLPQAVAVALAIALARDGTPADQLGPGGRDTTRITASPASLWRDILIEKDRKSTRLNSSHVKISYAVFCLKKKKMLNYTEKM